MAPKKTTADRAQLIFAPSRFARKDKKKNTSKLMRIGTAAAIEYIIMEILKHSVADEGSANPILKIGGTLKPRHIMFAIESSKMEDLFSGVVMPATGAIPNIHPALRPKTKKKRLITVR